MPFPGRWFRFSISGFQAAQSIRLRDKNVMGVMSEPAMLPSRRVNLISSVPND